MPHFYQMLHDLIGSGGTAGLYTVCTVEMAVFFQLHNRDFGVFHSRTDVLVQTERGNDKAVDPRTEHVRDEFIDMILIFVAAHKCERITVSAHGVFYFAQKKSIMRSIGRTGYQTDTVSLGGTKSPGRISWNVIQFPDRFVDLLLFCGRTVPPLIYFEMVASARPVSLAMSLMVALINQSFPDAVLLCSDRSFTERRGWNTTSSMSIFGKSV